MVVVATRKPKSRHPSKPIRRMVFILTSKIDSGDLILKPGWIRMSIHPTTTNAEIQFVTDSIKALAENHQEWAKDYNYSPSTNEFSHKEANHFEKNLVRNWFL